jgi:hypothetical protein
LNTWEKTWTETRMRWLAEQLGLVRLLDAEVILPTAEFFPDPYTEDPASARSMLDRLCAYAGVDPATVEIEFISDGELPAGVGHPASPERPAIPIWQRHLADPQALLALFAHELACVLLVENGRLTPDVPDHRWATALAPVFLGLGIFAANTTVYAKSGQSGHWSWWEVGRQGDLPSRIFGYAFALFAFMRGEDDPPWATYLRPDAAVPLREGLRYLRETDDSLFHPLTIGKEGSLSPAELVLRLQDDSPSVRLGSLWELSALDSTPALVEAATNALKDPDPYIPGEAARALGFFGRAALSAVPHLLDALHSSREITRAGAAQALGLLRPEDAAMVSELAALLSDPSRIVVEEAGAALAAFGRRAEPAVPGLLARFSTALVDCDQQLIETFAGALLAAVPDPRRRVREHFADDPELRRFALAALREEQERANEEVKETRKRS